jgi:TetR/AcrR family transcriptional repressor of bet genes
MELRYVQTRIDTNNHRDYRPLNTVAVAVKSSRRALPKEVRRDQLIRATIESIAQNGLAGTTMASITRQAGLSMGIANLHFESKEKLLTATLERVASEYNNGQNDILNSPQHKTVAEKLQALLDFHFSIPVTKKSKLAVWFAFWGEARSRPTYQRICSGSDIRAEKAIQSLFEEALSEGQYSYADADLLTRGYTALIDGLWLDLLITPRRMSRLMAKRIAVHYLSCAFPQHLSGDTAQ